MYPLIQSFYENVQTICFDGNVNRLIQYLSTDGLRLLTELIQLQLRISLNPIECRDFGLCLIQLIPICYSHITNGDAEQGLIHLPAISIERPRFVIDSSLSSISPLFQTLNYLFDIIVHLFYIHSDSTAQQPKSEINQTHVNIAEKLVHLSLPPLEPDQQRTIWFYQKFLRTLLLILRQMNAFQPSTLSTTFPSNPLVSLISTFHHSLNESSSSFFVHLIFDFLQGIALLIDRMLHDLFHCTSTHQRVTTDLFNLIEQILTSEYFSLFQSLNNRPEFSSRSSKLVEDCSNILKHLKLCRCDQGRRKSHRRSGKSSTNEQITRFHHHQTTFEISIPNRSQNDDDQNPFRRICIISAFYDKILRLIIKQFESNEPNLTFIQDCSTCLITCGSCSCYSLTHYRTLLSKMNHFLTERKTNPLLEQKTIQLIRQAFLLISNCSLRSRHHHHHIHHHHHHHDLALADNNPFWSYLCNHFFQRPTYFSLQLARAFPDLIQCCSTEEKQNALKLCFIPCLEFYRSNPQNSSMMIEYLVRTLPNLLFDIIIDLPLIPIADTLITLSTMVQSLLPHILPVLGCLLTSTVDSFTLNISETFVQLIIRLTNSWTLNNDGIDNLCHIIIILLQKSPLFRQAFYARHCHKRIHERFQRIMTNQSSIQSSVLACLLVCVSYHPKNFDEDFNYNSIVEEMKVFSQENRLNQSWFELLVRLSLSQLYQDRRTRWKSSTLPPRISISNDSDEDSIVHNDEDDDEIDDEDLYPADIESLAEEDQSEDFVIKEKQNRYSNLILFPELLLLGLKIAWENVDHEWNDQQCSIQSPVYVSNLVTHLEHLAALLRANTYNCSILKRFHLDEYLFCCLTTIVRRSAFFQKDVLITLIITLLQFIWSQSMTVHQLEQCFKLLLTHRSLLTPLLRLFRNLIHQIDPNQPRSYGSMPLTSILTSKSANQTCLTLEQLLTLKYVSIEQSFNVRQSALVTESLKNVQLMFPLSFGIWLRVNYPFDKPESIDDNSVEEQTNLKENRPWLHILTLQNEGIQLQFWLDSTPNLFFKLVQYASNVEPLKLIESTVRLCSLPQESWCHLFFTISKNTNSIQIYLNGQKLLEKKQNFSIPSLNNLTKFWSIALGQQSLDNCTSFYYDLGSILLFDKFDFSIENQLEHLPTYLYSLGSDNWHFLTNGHDRSSPLTTWIFQRFSRVQSSISIDQFQSRQSKWYLTLKQHLIASYSSSHPWTLFLFNFPQETNEELNTSRLTKIFPFRSSSSSSSSSSGANSSSNVSFDDPMNVASATISLPSKISLEQSSHILNICEQLGGILNFIYLFGKIIEMNTYPSADAIVHISDMIFSSIWKIKSYFELFHSLKGYHLIVKVLTSNECARYIGRQFYEILLEKSLINGQQRLFDVELFKYLLLDWRIWSNQSTIFSEILQVLNDLISDQGNPKYGSLNRKLFRNHLSLHHFVILCQELLEEQQQFVLNTKSMKILVNVIEALVENDETTIALPMDFVLFLHPLIKTYVNYNKEHFYFLSKPFHYFQKRENLPISVKKEKTIERRRPSNIVLSDDQVDSSHSTKETNTVRKSRSFCDLLDSSMSISVENETHSTRRSHHLTISDGKTLISTSKTFTNNGNHLGTDDSIHQIDVLSSGILSLLTNVALTVSDRLMTKLMKGVFRLDILIVLLLDSSMSKRIQCLKLVDIILKRMDREVVAENVIQKDRHIMLANQLYHQFDGRDDEKELLEVCVSIALQRPIEFDLKSTLFEQIGDPEQYFSILSSSPPCPRSQIGFALIFSLIEKLSVTNSNLCELLLILLDESLQRSTNENCSFLVDIGLTNVLFNTLLSAIATSQEKILVAVQKCFVTLTINMFMAPWNDEISFISILDNIIGIILLNNDQINKSSPQLAEIYQYVVHQTLSQMLNSIIDFISKPLVPEPKFYSSGSSRMNLDESNTNLTSIENAEKLRKFLQLGSDYIHLFHHQAVLIEKFTLNFLNLCLLGLAYLIEKRSSSVSHRNPWAAVMIRCGETIKPVAQKLLIIALDPTQQRYFFRIEILKQIIDQPNKKGIIEYLLMNESHMLIYQEVLLYIRKLSQTSPTTAEDENLSLKLISRTNGEKSIELVDTELSISLVPVPNKLRIVSNGDDSSAHTVNLAVRPYRRKSVDVLFQHQNNTKNSAISSSSSLSFDNDEKKQSRQSRLDQPKAIELPIRFKLQSASSNDEREVNGEFKITRSPSSFSVSSYSSGQTGSFHHPSSKLANRTIKEFRELLAGIHHNTSTSTHDPSLISRRALNEFLLKFSSSVSNLRSNNTNNTLHSRFSFNWPASVSVTEPLPSRRSVATATSPSPVNITWESVAEEKHREYQEALRKTIEIIRQRAYATQKSLLNTFTDSIIPKITTGAMDITQEVIQFHNAERKKYLQHLRDDQSVDLQIKHLWHQLISQLTHEYGIWFEAASYPKFWQLDPTENPQRERRRLQRSYCLMGKRFFENHVPEEVLVSPPLAYLFDTRNYQSINIQTILHRNEKIEYQCRCTNVAPNIEIKGDLLVSLTRIYFVADEPLNNSSTKEINSAMASVAYNYQSFNNDANSFSFAIEDICEMHKRRYMLKDVGLELFLIHGITWMIAHASRDERDILYQALARRYYIHKTEDETADQLQNSWRQGHLTNFDYLMQLNKFSGRTYLDLMQYPVFPYIVAKYDDKVLDLRDPKSYRKLDKPIAIQSPEREERFIDTYRALDDAYQLACAEHDDKYMQESISSSMGHQSKPYHYASLYSNSGVVLHYLVRLLPYTRMFLDYQDKNFDCADRTFHDVRTSYWLSSFESTSDFKELIPEFYYLHEFLINKQGFFFGNRQNGEKVSDVTMTMWSKGNPRLYVYALRQALESEYVSMHLPEWIDLIFGFKQTDKAALDAVNVYNPACYYGFPVDDISDEVTQKAYYGIIRTYGQVPKKLFFQPHQATNHSHLSPSTSDKRSNERALFESRLPEDSIHRLVVNVRWGQFIGSYDMPSPEYVSRMECPVQISSFVVHNMSNSLICLPSSSLLIYNEYSTNETFRRSVAAETLTSNSSSSTSLDAVIALKWNSADGIVRARLLKQMKTWYNVIVPTDDQDKITCCASSDNRLLFIGKTSGLIEIYRIQRNKKTPLGLDLSERCLPFIAHRSAITCLYANRSFSLLISASADGMLTLWDTNRLSYVRTYNQDNQRIYHLTSSDTTGDIAYLSSTGFQWFLSYLTCNCDLIGCLNFDEQINCLCFTSAPEGTAVNILLGGFESGKILMWSTWDLTLLRQFNPKDIHLSPIVSLCLSKVDQRRLYVVDRSRGLHVLESRVSSSNSMHSPPLQLMFLL